jgi:hypothetical protein
MDDFVWVKWLNSPRPADDGAYMSFRFKETVAAGVVSEVEPKNNDGREECYWGHGRTVRKPGLTNTFYNICPTCQK